MSNLNKRQWLQLILLAIAIISWVLSKANILHVPGLTGLTLGITLGMVGVSYTKEELLALNEQLSKIKKPKK